MFATIEGVRIGQSWAFTVKAPGRSISGFTSLESAAGFIEMMNWILWDDPDGEE